MWPFTSSPSYPELSPQQVGRPWTDDASSKTNSEFTYDYIVVGGGTAGCALANRLSEDPDVTVLLLERGARDDSWASRVPLMSSNINRADSERASYASNYAWSPEPQPNLPKVGYADYTMITGKGLGGTSRVNGMVYTRGLPAEYNAWAEMGCTGWAWKDVEPYFIKSEKALGALATYPHHGTSGQWTISGYGQYYFPHFAKSIDACAALGLPYIPDANSPDHPAFGCADFDVTMNSNGQRCSTYHAFLPLHTAVERQARLKIATQTLVSKIVFSASAGARPRAIGVVLENEDVVPGAGKFFAKAKREVILCAGAIGNPQLLQLSGIGPADHLRSKSVAIVKDLKGVGANLRDHFGVSVSYRIPLYDSFHALTDTRFVPIKELLKYFLFGKGSFLAPLSQISIFTRSDLLDADSNTVVENASAADGHNPANIPDIEIMPIPFSCSGEMPVRGEAGCLTFLTCLAQPYSCGSVRIQSTDPRTRPACDLGFLNDRRDWPVLRKAIYLSMQIGENIRKTGYDITPWRVLPDNASDEEMKEFVTRQARTCYHYACTCRMASEDDPEGAGVVDPELRVHGVDGLRIADCSVFPRIIATHLQAPAVMVAEKCADMIKATRRAMNGSVL